MLWLWVTVGIFVLLAAAMVLPDWIRFARWDARRKKLPPNRARKMRAPVAAPFWSGYAGPIEPGVPHSGHGPAGSDDGIDGGFDGGGFDGGGDGGGGD